VRAELRWSALLLASGLAAGCGGGEVSEEGQRELEPASEVAAAQASPDTSPALRRFLPDAMRRATRAETFPHDAHGQIDCAVCHQVPQGHGSHDTVECADCHRASALTTVRALTPGQCASCHHGTEQAFGCEHCHGTPGTLRSAQTLALEVWAAPRTRELDFEHGRHSELTCASCHQTPPSLAAASCASCHAEHHVATVRCASCHTPPAAGAHDVQAHLTCSGSGCHSAPLVEAIADTRAVCLVCHQAQEDHEPGGSCIECHRVRPGLGGRLRP
jgi:hypothetical protein